MKESVGLLIAAARRQIKRAVKDRVARHGFSPQQFWVLVNVDEARGPSLREIADRLRLDAPTASRAVAHLVRRKLVKAEGDRGDRRRLRLWLTPLGRERIGPLHQLAAELRSATVQGLSREEEETLRILLLKMIANLGAARRGVTRAAVAPRFRALLPRPATRRWPR